MNNRKKISPDELVELILLAFDGKITEEQFNLLDQQIVYHQEVRDYYFKLLTIFTGLNDYGNSGIFFKAPDLTNQTTDFPDFSRFGIKDANGSFDMSLWSQLAQAELASPAIELPKKPEKTDVTISTYREPLIKLRTNRSAIISLIISAAAMILIILFARYAPKKSSSEIATLVRTVNAKWANASFENGSRLVIGDVDWQLKSGVAELLFDNNTRVTIEGPVEFHIAMADQMALNYGRLYASVPSEAIGFTITTPNSKIIDLGTEFGIEAGFGGTTELHVVKGKTTLISGAEEKKKSVMVTEGLAKKVSGVNGRISDIVCDRIKFARKINTDGNRIWRGENVQLASIIAGHDGFRDVGSLIGLNPATGEYTTSIMRDNRASKKAYTSVPVSDFIDGVFVPDGQNGAIPITSNGLTFECTNTAGLFTHEIAVYKGNIENQHDTIPPAIFGGHEYETEPIVVLHSNVGITFDLQAIRATLPEMELKCFKAAGGISESLKDVDETADVDFWILVDGQIRYERKLLKVDDGLIDFEIQINLQDRFLTLIVGDGLRKEDGKREFPYSNDFLYLINPELCLTE